MNTIQQEILQTLADGKPHSRDELMKVFDAPTATYKNLNAHLCLIRKKLRRHGEDIICEVVRRKYCYRHVRLLRCPYDGRT